MKLYPTALDLTDVRIGRLTIKEFVRRSRRGNWWRCVCDCGNFTYEATAGDLKSGRITSCGCYRNSQEFADTKVVHGHRRQNKGETSRTYNAWCDMKKRCDVPTANNYAYYGGKGITYDPRWVDFRTFLSDMGECPEGYELDRLRSDQNYTIDNCRWLEGSIHAHRPRKLYNPLEEQ